MTRNAPERLYELLPIIYRARDAAKGEPLRALLRVLEEELVLVEEDIARLYDSWFVETCDEWLLPYIGELVGTRLMHGTSQRAATANTLAFKRRKGTLATIAAIARDVSGWPARVVEYLPLVAAAQDLDCPRPLGVTTASLRQPDDLLQVGSPFDKASHLIDVRTRGRYAPAQVGLYVWRTGVHRLEKARAAKVKGQSGFTVNALGYSTMMWSPARSRVGLQASTEMLLAPQPISRRVLYRVLEARRQALVDGRTVLDPYFDGEPVFAITVVRSDGKIETLPPEEILAVDLSKWWLPPPQLTYRRRGDGQEVSRKISAALDPELGRLTFPAENFPSQVFITYHYGQTAEIGGGYPRERTAPPSGCVQKTVKSDELAPDVLQSLADPTSATSLWSGSSGQLVVEIGNSNLYLLDQITIPAGGRLVLRAASGHRPLLVPTAPLAEGADGPMGKVQIRCGAGSALVIEDVLIKAFLDITAPAAGESASISLCHATLLPGIQTSDDGSSALLFPNGSSVLGLGSGALHLRLDRCITGRIALPSNGTVTASDSIIDGLTGTDPALQAGEASLLRVTVFGDTRLGALSQTRDTLFRGTVSAPFGQENDIVCCFLPEDADVPATDRCQPATALSPTSLSAADKARLRKELRPYFISERYGTPGYAQLAVRCHPAIRQGASDEGEIGALHHQHLAQREANLVDIQAEYLRYGLTLNLFLAT
jgi:hypothetical protein